MLPFLSNKLISLDNLIISGLVPNSNYFQFSHILKVSGFLTSKISLHHNKTIKSLFPIFLI